MEIEDNLQRVELELVEIFREYKKLGKYHYSPELKEKVFAAYNLNITPGRIVELCNVSLCAATSWYHIFRKRRTNSTPKSINSFFREIKISPPEQEKITPTIKESLNSVRERSTINSLKIKFPNGIEIKCKTSEVKNFIHDLFFIQS